MGYQRFAKLYERDEHQVLVQVTYMRHDRMYEDELELTYTKFQDGMLKCFTDRTKTKPFPLQDRRAVVKAAFDSVTEEDAFARFEWTRDRKCA